MQKLAALFLTFLLVAPTLAQDRNPVVMDEKIRWTLTAEQIRVSLESTNEAVKTQTLKNVIVLATLYRDKIDMADQLRALRTMYQESGSTDHSNLARAAMLAIGSYRAYDYVARNATAQEVEEGRLLMASVLNEYYLTRSAGIAS